MKRAAATRNVFGLVAVALLACAALLFLFGVLSVLYEGEGNGEVSVTIAGAEVDADVAGGFALVAAVGAGAGGFALLRAAGRDG